MADLRVVVAWVTPTTQDVVPLTLPPGATAAAAIAASGLATVYRLDIRAARIGVNGRLARPDTELADGDRVEIYRPLVADAKAVRRARARTKPIVAAGKKR